MTLSELIAALERADGPSRELDLRIARDVLNSEPLGHAAGMSDDLLLMQADWGPWPRYTSSIDAALTLVPEGLVWLVDGTAPELGIDWVLMPPGPPPPTGEWKGTHNTPALALVIAALKARGEG